MQCQILPQLVELGSRAQQTRGMSGYCQSALMMVGVHAQEAAVTDYSAQLRAVPQFATYGQLFKSCAAQQLTEEETEYTIRCIKHIFDAHVVFQFECINTVPEQVLEDVNVLIDLAEAVSALSQCIPLPGSGLGAAWQVTVHERIPAAAL